MMFGGRVSCSSEGSMLFIGRVCWIEMLWLVSIHQILLARYPEEQENAPGCWNLAEFRPKFGWQFVPRYPYEFYQEKGDRISED